MRLNGKRNTRKKISKIVEDMLTYCYSVGAAHVKLELHEEELYHEIIFITDYDPKYRDILMNLEESLAIGRQPDIERMYWQLSGNSDLDDELEYELIGSMLDEVNITVNDNTCEIRLIRYRNINN